MKDKSGKGEKRQEKGNRGGEVERNRESKEE